MLDAFELAASSSDFGVRGLGVEVLRVWAAGWRVSGSGLGLGLSTLVCLESPTRFQNRVGPAGSTIWQCAHVMKFGPLGYPQSVAAADGAPFSRTG